MIGQFHDLVYMLGKIVDIATSSFLSYEKHYIIYKCRKQISTSATTYMAGYIDNDKYLYRDYRLTRFNIL